MSIKKRGNTYYTDFTDPQGKRVRISTSTSDKKLAQEFEAKLKNDLWRQIKLGDKPQYLLSDAIIRYFKTIQKSTNEVIGDQHKLKFWLTKLGDIPLSFITRDLVESVLVEMNHITLTTRNRYLSPLKHLLNLAKAKWEWITTVPSIDPYAEPKQRIRFITVEQAKKLLTHLPEHLALMAEFTLCTGLRQSNVTDLTWSQVNFFNNTVSYEAADMKAAKALPVPLNARAIEILKSQVNKHKKYVFVYDGHPVGKVQHRTWKKALDKAGIKDFRWHDLRHTWASWHVQRGTPLNVLMQLGGWASYEMVLRYAHLSAQHLANAVDNYAWDDTNLSHGTVVNLKERA